MGLNPQSQPYEIKHALQLAKPKLVITSPAYMPNILKASENSNAHEILIILLDDEAINRIREFLSTTDHHDQTETQSSSQSTTFSGSRSNRTIANADSDKIYNTNSRILNFSSLLQYQRSPWVRFPLRQGPSPPAALYLTSGTSGLPKAAILSHRSIIAQHLAIYYDVPYPVTRLVSLPLFHLFGALWTHIFPIRYGQPVYILPRLEVEQFLDSIFAYRITETYLVPTMVRAIINHCEQWQESRSVSASGLLASLRYVGVAGAPIDKESMEKFQAVMHPREGLISQIWGMTEVGVVFQERYNRDHIPNRDHSPSHREERYDAGSVGRPLASFYDVKILETDLDTGTGSVGKERREVTRDGQTGELFVRGRMGGLFDGYLGAGGSNEKSIDLHGWFRTGDIVTVHSGRYYVKGRVKELIKVRG